MSHQPVKVEPYAPEELPAVGRVVVETVTDTVGPEPEPHGPPPDPFPVECLPAPVSQYVTEVSSAMALPLDLVAMNALGCLSAAIGAGLELVSGPRSTVRGNLFILVVAGSGTGKGRAFAEVMCPLQDYESRVAKEWRENKLPGVLSELELVECEIRRVKNAVGSGKGDRDSQRAELTDLKRHLAEFEAERDREPLVFLSDTTKEALAARMALAPGEALASLSAEGRGAVANLLGRYNKGGGQGDEDIYLSGYSGDSCKVARIGRPAVHLKRPCLSVLWSIQPDKLATLLGESATTESGLLPRFLIVEVQPTDVEPTGEVVSDGRWAELVEALLALRESVGDGDPAPAVGLSDEAAGIYGEYKSEVRARVKTGGDLADVATYAARWVENAYRIGLILHAAEHGPTAGAVALSAATAEAAVTIQGWFSRRILATLAAGRAEAQWQRLQRLEDILRRYDGAAPLWRLRDKHGFPEDETRGLADEFPGRIEIVTDHDTGGRPATVVRTRNGQ